jgi:type II secretory pathway pseudopilin PulG
MLLVITTIVILAGLLLGGINMALRKAEIQKAQTSAFQLATAFRNFQSEYGTWPNDNAAAQTVDNTLLSILIGQDTGGKNPRRIVFFEPESKSVKPTGYVDPWNNVYGCKFDQTYTGAVIPPDGSNSVSAGVVVWSTGPKGASATNGWVKTW